jgi:hypothetical protein
MAAVSLRLDVVKRIWADLSNGDKHWGKPELALINGSEEEDDAIASI